MGVLGGQKNVIIEGKGKVTQISMDDALKLQEVRNASELEKRLVEPLESEAVAQSETARLRTEYQDRITEIDNILSTPGKVPSEYGSRAILEQEIREGKP